MLEPSDLFVFHTFFRGTSVHLIKIPPRFTRIPVRGRRILPSLSLGLQRIFSNIQRNISFCLNAWKACLFGYEKWWVAKSLISKVFNSLYLIHSWKKPCLKNTKWSSFLLMFFQQARHLPPSHFLGLWSILMWPRASIAMTKIFIFVSF